MQKKLLMAIAVSGLFVSSNVFAAADGPWMVRARAVHVSWVIDSDPVGAGFNIPQNGIHLEHKTVPEVDISYFFTKNIAAELILTYPQKHGIHVSDSAVGPFDAGDIHELPPTLLVQYHFMPDATFRPYVGAGWNYTRFSKVNLAPLNNITGGTNSIDKSSNGGALQIGFDYKVGANSYINVDVKKIFIQTDIKNSALGKIATLKGDPYLFGVGYGMKF